jgi:LysM repeat protein
MIDFIKIIMIGLLFCLTPVVQGSADNVIWESENDYLDIRWTTSDITAAKNGKQTFSAQALAKKEFEADFITAHQLPQCEYERKLSLLSIVGNIASIKQIESVTCEGLAEPSIETRWTAFDLVHPDSKMPLTRFFTESDILKALLRDSVIQKALATANTSHPSTLQGLYEALEWSNITVKDCEYQLPEDFLNQFAVYRIQRRTVAIRLNLPAASFSSCESKNIQLGIYLPIPRSERKLFNQVRRGQKGFLMAQTRKSAYAKTTEVSFSTKSYAQPEKRKFQATFSFSKAIASHKKINTITVQAGDTLSEIAKKWDRSLDDMAAWNNLSPPYELSIGQTLLIDQPTDHSEKTTYHTVDSGENLYDIAKKYGHSLQELATWNHLLPPYRLSIGDRLQISEPLQKKTTANNVLTQTLPDDTIGEQVVQATPVDTAIHEIEGIAEIAVINAETPKSQMLQAVQIETAPKETLVVQAENRLATIKQRIITASNVYVRSSPERGAKLVGKLKLGTIVKELARSDTQEQIGQSKDYWYQIELSSKKQGWIFGTLSTEFNPKQRAQHYQKIAQARLNKALSWPDMVDLTAFLALAKKEIYAVPEIAAELGLLHLHALQKAINQVENSDIPPYRAWFEQQLEQELIYLDEVRAIWLVDSRLFWRLHEQYYPLPISEQIAWAGAENPIGGECEGFLVCYLHLLNETTGKYLKYHPEGQYVEKALNKIADLLIVSDTTEDFFVDEEEVDLLRFFDVLRATVQKTHHSSTNALLNQIDQFRDIRLAKQLNLQD